MKSKITTWEDITLDQYLQIYQLVDDEVFELLQLKEKMDLYIEKKEILNRYNILEKLSVQTVVFIEMEKYI